MECPTLEKNRGDDKPLAMIVARPLRGSRSTVGPLAHFAVLAQDATGTWILHERTGATPRDDARRVPVRVISDSLRIEIPYFKDPDSARPSMPITVWGNPLSTAGGVLHYELIPRYHEKSLTFEEIRSGPVDRGEAYRDVKMDLELEEIESGEIGTWKALDFPHLWSGEMKLDEAYELVRRGMRDYKATRKSDNCQGFAIELIELGGGKKPKPAFGSDFCYAAARFTDSRSIDPSGAPETFRGSGERSLPASRSDVGPDFVMQIQSASTARHLLQAHPQQAPHVTIADGEYEYPHSSHRSSIRIHNSILLGTPFQAPPLFTIGPSLGTLGTGPPLEPSGLSESPCIISASKRPQLLIHGPPAPPPEGLQTYMNNRGRRYTFHPGGGEEPDPADFDPSSETGPRGTRRGAYVREEQPAANSGSSPVSPSTQPRYTFHSREWPSSGGPAGARVRTEAHGGFVSDGVIGAGGSASRGGVKASVGGGFSIPSGTPWLGVTLAFSNPLVAVGVVGGVLLATALIGSGGSSDDERKREK